MTEQVGSSNVTAAPASHDVSLVDTRRVCTWCGRQLSPRARGDAKFCGKRCRQASWRFKVSSAPAVATDRPMRFAYADPPYPDKASYYVEKQEVDHASLVDRLVAEYPDGWALSTSSAALRDVLLLCPADVRVCAWFKGPRRTKSRRALVSWEPLIVAGGRPLTRRRRSGPRRRLDRARTLPRVPGCAGRHEAAGVRRMDVPSAGRDGWRTSSTTSSPARARSASRGPASRRSGIPTDASRTAAAAVAAAPRDASRLQELDKAA